MSNDIRPIGVFDSGLGGISVLIELTKLMPNENFIYFGDSKNAPYGTRPSEEVATLTSHTAEYLVGRGCKCLVIACNTATVAAVTPLRAKYSDIPVIGIEPALKPAALENPGRRILVMATHVTLNQAKFLKLLDRFKNDADITTLECPGIVEFVEQDRENTSEFTDYLTNLLSDYIDNPPDAIVLGCTHFPFVKYQIAKVLHGIPKFYDGGNGTARETLHQLNAFGITADSKSIGSVEFLNSNEAAIALERKLFNK